MNILYIAYSCAPEKGSEEKIGWSLPIAAAKYNRVFVLTKEEHRTRIESYIHDHNIENIQFYYVDIPSLYKKLYRGMAYSGRLNVWHKYAYPVVEEICKTEKIDLIHQITPVEFRSIGDYGKIPDVKFVCGPIGGGEYIPEALTSYAKQHILVEWVRKLLNQASLRRLRKNGALDRCDVLLFANEETKEYLLTNDSKHAAYPCQTEIGISAQECIGKQAQESTSKGFVFLVAGRLIYRKGHALLLDALCRMPKNLEYTCEIIGSGPESRKLKKKTEKLGLANRVVFIDRIPFQQMNEKYAEADALIMPSIRETTGSVILEAMAKGLPVIACDGYGAAVNIDRSTGWLYRGNSKEAYVNALAEVLQYCIAHPEEVHQRGQNAVQAAKKQDWDNKAAYFHRLYTQVLADDART